MCGIIGYIAAARRPELEQAVGLLAHRGPDGAGEISGNVAGVEYWIGHRRLSIIDIDGGRQPLIKHRLAITFNGEIYNYVELAAELTNGHGVQFTTRSDTEVLLEAFRVWGPACLRRLNGMWAFAILNLDTGELFCARDRMGKKPFYYAHTADGFFFASEPAPLTKILAKVEADRETLVAYLLGAEAPLARSFFADICRLPPAHTLTLAQPAGRPLVARYWSPWDGNTERIDFDTAAEQLRALLADSVAIRLRSDVGFAVAASGGLDSTIVLATAAERSREPVQTVSVTFDETFSSDETAFIEGLAEHFTIRPTYARSQTTISLAELLDDMKRSVVALSEPTPYTSVPYVSKLYEATARAGIKVLLEGQGADELFGGYPYFRAHQRFAIARGWTSVRDYLLAARRRSTVVRDAYYRLNTFHPHLSNAARELAHFPPLTPSVQDALIDAQNRTVLPGLLDYSDRLAMHHGVEVRLPFLDYRIVELVNRLPSDFKVHGRETKRILRHAYADLVPQEILERSKVGFGSPTGDLIHANLDLLAEQFIARGRFANSSLFRTGWLRHLRTGFLRTLPNKERIVWRFMMVDSWLDHFGVELA